MKKLVFDKKIEKYCKYCRHGKLLEFSGEVFCTKKGFVEPFGKCLKYRYDPLKRIPDTAVVTGEYSKEDFSL